MTVELSPKEATYVDQMVGRIISGVLGKDSTSMNPEYFKLLAQSAYRSALILLEVRKDYITEPEELREITIEGEIPSIMFYDDDMMKKVSKSKVSLKEEGVEEVIEKKEKVAKPKTKVKTKPKVKAAAIKKAAKKRGRPPKNKSVEATL